MRGVKCEESRKICFKILRKNLDGDPKQIIAELQTLQTYPDKEGKVKAINPVICPNCHIRGHSEKDCWANAEFAKAGDINKNIAGRDRESPGTQPVRYKKLRLPKKKKIEGQRVAKTKAEAKKAQEATDDSPSDEFEDDDSSDDNSSPREEVR